MIDLRVGKGDRFIRYYFYAINTKSKEVLENKVQAIGRFYGKDITPSNFVKNDLGNIMRSNHHEITIETMDRVDLKPDMLILNTADNSFYIIRTIEEETVNTSQQFSRRPVTKKTITIRKGA